MSTRLYVGNLSYSVTQEDLRQLFSRQGPVLKIDLAMEAGTGRPGGSALVTMETWEGAKAAIHALNGMELHGRSLEVNEAADQEKRGSFGGTRGSRRRHGHRPELPGSSKPSPG